MVLTRKNLDWWCERGILLLVLGMLVFAPLAFGAVNAWAFLVVQGLAAGVFVLWVVRLWVDRKPKLLWPPLAWVVVAFTLYAVARYFTADIEYVARLEMIQVVLFAFLFFTVVNNLHGQDEALIISFTLIALATLIAGYAVAFSRAGWMAAAAGIFLLLGILLGHGNHRLKAVLLLVVMLAGGGYF